MLAGIIAIWSVIWFSAVVLRYSMIKENFDLFLASFFMTVVGFITNLVLLKTSIFHPKIFWFVGAYFLASTLTFYILRWMNKKWNLGKKIWERTKAVGRWLWSKTKKPFQWWQKRDSKILKRANKRLYYLLSLLSESKWDQEREALTSVVHGLLPNLLKQREELELSIKRVKVLIARSQDTSHSSFGANLVAETTHNKEILEDRLKQRKTDIVDVQTFLHHVESNIHIALQGSDEHQNLASRLSVFVEDISARAQAVEEEDAMLAEVLSFESHR